MSSFRRIAGAGIFVLASAGSVSASEQVGEAVKINTVVVGAEGAKTEGDAVYRDELVRANATGLGQFEFKDGTKLAIGPNASVVIDKYVLGEGGTLKKLAIRATKGTFRFIGGRSPPGTYTILTPAGTMGVRGTANEVQILPDGRVIVVQLEGSSEFCTNPKDRRTCRVLNKPCDFVVANGKTGEITDPKQISDEAVEPDNFPLLRDDKELVEGFNLGGISCGLSNSASAQAINPALAAAVIGAGVVAAIVVIANSGDDEEEPVTPP
jgi:hypothetical protein